jgi:penicillin-insensitive murein DD-endopeptidase
MPRPHFSLPLLLSGLLAATVASASALAAVSWGEARVPTSGPTRIIGGPASGCIAGAVRLPNEGPGFQAIRVGRNRHYGHPDTVAFVERLGKRAAAAGLPPFYVGDMSQPRGGPMAFGHGSHQNGLDVDIWFNLDPKPLLPAAARDDVDLPSMVLPDQSDIDRTRFGERQVRILRMAAGDPRVDRIFVHWTIKQALCEGYAGADEGSRAWLHKLRPWRGHDEHFHVRLACPPGAAGCVGQAPVPPGDGCDESLEWWARTRPPLPAPTPRMTPVRAAPRSAVPAQCRALLKAR